MYMYIHISGSGEPQWDHVGAPAAPSGTKKANGSKLCLINHNNLLHLIDKL